MGDTLTEVAASERKLHQPRRPDSNHDRVGQLLRISESCGLRVLQY